MPKKQNRGNRHPHAPTATARKTMQAVATPSHRDPFAITAPVDTSYRYHHSEHAYIERSATDRYGALVPNYIPEEE